MVSLSGKLWGEWGESEEGKAFFKRKESLVVKQDLRRHDSSGLARV
jgi:hypothetical protein